MGLRLRPLPESVTAFRFRFAQAWEMAVHLDLIVPDFVFGRLEKGMARVTSPVVVLIAAPRSLPEIDLASFPLVDSSRSRIGSVIVDLSFAAVCSAAAAELGSAVVVVAAVAGLVRLSRIADSPCLACSSLAVTGKGRAAAGVVSYSLAPQSFSLRNRNSPSPLCFAVRASGPARNDRVHSSSRRVFYRRFCVFRHARN